jgi:hypothetical protein
MEGSSQEEFHLQYRRKSRKQARPSTDQQRDFTDVPPPFCSDVSDEDAISCPRCGSLDLWLPSCDSNLLPSGWVCAKCNPSADCQRLMEIKDRILVRFASSKNRVKLGGFTEAVDD